MIYSTVEFQGGSDDLVSVAGTEGKVKVREENNKSWGEYNVILDSKQAFKRGVAYGSTLEQPAVFTVTDAKTGEAIGVYAFYFGTWVFAAGHHPNDLEGDDPIPQTWAIETKQSRDTPYSTVLTIDVPSDEVIVEAVTS